MWPYLVFGAIASVVSVMARKVNNGLVLISFWDVHFQTLTSQSNYLGYFVAKTISFLVSAAKYKPFVEVTAEDLVFGYDDTLVTLAHKFYPRHKRPMSKMGLLLAVSHYSYLSLLPR